jgi:hypothetical protein
MKIDELIALFKVEVKPMPLKFPGLGCPVASSAMVRVVSKTFDRELWSSPVAADMVNWGTVSRYAVVS